MRVSHTHRAGKVHKFLRVQNPPTPCPLLIRVQRFGKESLRQGRFFPAHARGQARSFALTPCVPLSRRRERGNALQGAPPCAPTPLSHAVGEGLGVRAKKRARPAHSELKRCTLISPKFPCPPLTIAKSCAIYKRTPQSCGDTPNRWRL